MHGSTPTVNFPSDAAEQSRHLPEPVAANATTSFVDKVEASTKLFNKTGEPLNTYIAELRGNTHTIKINIIGQIQSISITKQRVSATDGKTSKKNARKVTFKKANAADKGSNKLDASSKPASSGPATSAATAKGPLTEQKTEAMQSQTGVVNDNVNKVATSTGASANPTVSKPSPSGTAAPRNNVLRAAAAPQEVFNSYTNGNSDGQQQGISQEQVAKGTKGTKGKT